MKTKDIKAGLNCSVGWFTNGFMSNRTDYLAHGEVILRRGGAIKFRWISGDYMGCDFHGWPRRSDEFFRVNVLDIKSVNGVPIKAWLAPQTSPTI